MALSFDGRVVLVTGAGGGTLERKQLDVGEDEKAANCLLIMTGIDL